MILSTLGARIEGQEYPIWIGNDMIREVAGCIDAYTRSKRILLLSDAVFRDGYCARLESALRADGFDVLTVFMPGGKANKTITTALAILTQLEEKEFTRDATLIALGGGIVGDVGGFVAAMYFRGMNLLQIPTTITGQIDSSIGGKVAVNHGQTINAIGTYYHPKAILLDLDFILGLPERELRSGMGEVVKSAIIRDRAFCDLLMTKRADILSRDLGVVGEMVRRTVRIKLDHVEQDPREKGIRLHLNYGHTVGQAIEIATSLEHEFFRHGEAVALGMLAAAHIADAHYADGGERVRYHREMIAAFGLPLSLDAAAGSDRKTLEREIFANLFKDKKRVASGLRFVLAPAKGSAEVVTGVQEKLIRGAIASLFTAA